MRRDFSSASAPIRVIRGKCFSARFSNRNGTDLRPRLGGTPRPTKLETVMSGGANRPGEPRTLGSKSGLLSVLFTTDVSSAFAPIRVLRGPIL